MERNKVRVGTEGLIQDKVGISGHHRGDSNATRTTGRMHYKNKRKISSVCSLQPY